MAGERSEDLFNAGARPCQASVAVPLTYGVSQILQVVPLESTRDTWWLIRHRLNLRGLTKTAALDRIKEYIALTMSCPMADKQTSSSPTFTPVENGDNSRLQRAPIPPYD